MATSAFSIPRPTAPASFFRATAIIMALVIVVGFSAQFLAGRSSFGARPLVHVHGLVFMGWTAIFLTQALLATSGRIDVHRRLGKLAMLWVPLMVVVAFAIIMDVTQRGTAPFFFRPQYFLIANPLTMLMFAGLFAFAVGMRRQTDWHMRLQICATSCIMGPAFGRLLPMPLLIPYAHEAAVMCGLLFPLAGIVRDLRNEKRVHPAWWFGVGALCLSIIMAHLLAFSPIGNSLYTSVTAGHPGAAVPGLEFAPFSPVPG